MGVIKGRPRSAIDASTHEPRPFRHNDNDNIFGSDDDITNALPLPLPVIELDLILNLQQESGALISYEQRFRRRSNRTRVAAIPSDTTPPPKKSQKIGAKKGRRYENQLILLKNCEMEAQELNEVTFDDLSPFNSSRTFGRLLEDMDLINVWNEFIEAKDDEGKTMNITTGSGKRCLTIGKSIQNQTESEAFNGICRKLRGMLKQRHLPLGMMDNLEENLLQYFFDHPLGTFESTPLDAFRRGLLHALSQYNNLCSYSINDKNKKSKIVRVQNKYDEFSPPPVRLVHYIESKFHKNIHLNNGETTVPENKKIQPNFLY